jgi:hypothetical protein
MEAKTLYLIAIERIKENLVHILRKKGAWL